MRAPIEQASTVTTRLHIGLRAQRGTLKARVPRRRQRRRGPRRAPRICVQCFDYSRNFSGRPVRRGIARAISDCASEERRWRVWCAAVRIGSPFFSGDMEAPAALAHIVPRDAPDRFAPPPGRRGAGHRATNRVRRSVCWRRVSAAVRPLGIFHKEDTVAHTIRAMTSKVLPRRCACAPTIRS